MSELATITQKIATALGTDSGLGKIIKLDLGDAGKVLINGAVVPNSVTNEDAEADTTISMTMENFVALAKGELDPMAAFMSGKLKVQGDIMLAQKLGPLLKG
jgi:putative sterol carrier protein